MAATQAAFSVFSSYPATYPKSQLYPKTRPPVKLIIFTSTHKLSLKSPFSIRPLFSNKTPTFEVQSGVENVAVLEEEQEKEDKVHKNNQRRKLFVLNLPWTYSVTDIKNLFGECGAVSDVEIIKQKDGKNRGFAFVTMATGEEAQAAIDKFDSYELSGRIIRVEFAKRFKKPKPTPSGPSAPRPGETRHKLYVSNLAWKVRSNNLREFFSANYSPISSRVVFDNPSGRSAGYGFVTFATKEEAEAAISALDGKELMGRPISLKFSEKNVEAEPEIRPEETTEEQPAES